MNTEMIKASCAPKRIYHVYRMEISKALHRKFTYLGPIVVTLTVIIIALVQKFTLKEPDGYAFIAFATPLALNMLGLLLLLMYSAGLMSSEIGSGSIRMVLVRAIRRYDLVVAKLLLAMSYAAVMTLCVTVTAWLMALLLSPLQGIMFGEEQIYTRGDMALAYLCGAALVLLPQFATAAFGVMISTLIRSTGGALGAVVCLWLVTDILKYPIGVEKYLFSSYIEMPWQVFAGRCDGLNPTWFPEAAYCIGVSLAFFLGFTAIAVFVLARKDFRV